VKELSSGTFSGCDQLTRLDLGSTLTAIPGGAFASCSALTELVIPDQITSIGEGAFSGCSGLTSVYMGTGLTVISESAFKKCSALKSVTLGESVQVLGDSAFEGCTNLESIVMSPALKSLGSNLFKSVYRLLNITFTGDAPTFADDTLAKMNQVTIPVTIKYPCSNSTWTEEHFKNYSHGYVQWLPDHVCKNGVCTLCGAKEILDNGMCGVYWYLEVDGTLTVYGKGTITRAPLETPDSEQVKTAIIGDGITHLSNYSFPRKYTNLESIIFTGDAPTFSEDAFYLLTTTAYYPADNPTWTADKLQNYGGNITWKPACVNGHTYVYTSNNDATADADGTKTGICSFCTKKETVTDEGSRLVSMAVTTAPNKTNYLINEPAVDMTGAVATVTCADGRTFTVDVTNDMVTGFDTSAAGTNTLTVSYRGLTAACDVTVGKATVIFQYADGTVISSAEYNYGDAVVIPPEPEKPAGTDPEYIFRGWGKVVSPTCTESVTYTAVFGPKVLPGDFTNDDLVTNEDVSYLLWHTLFPADYPL